MYICIYLRGSQTYIQVEIYIYICGWIDTCVYIYICMLSYVYVCVYISLFTVFIYLFSSVCITFT